MTTTAAKPRVTSFAPQFLVDDLARSIDYYKKLGFTFGEPWDGFFSVESTSIERFEDGVVQPHYRVQS